MVMCRLFGIVPEEAADPAEADAAEELDTSSGITNATQRLVTIGEGPDSESSGEVEVGTWGAVNPTFSSEVVTGRDGIPAAEA